MKTAHPLYLDLRALAVSRVGLGVLMVADLTARLGDLGVFYTDAGLIPRSALELPWYSIHGWAGGPTWAAACLLLNLAAALAWALGWRTRAACVACLVMTVGLHARAPSLLHRGDVVLRLALLWGLLLPMGARWSLDARAGRAPHDGADRVQGLAAWGWTLQLAQIYLWSVAYKLHPAWTHDATAVHEALSLDAYTTSLGRWVLARPALTCALTWGTLALEAAGPLLLFLRSPRTRVACVLIFLGFHAGLMATMRLGTFMPIMWCVWASMTPSRTPTDSPNQAHARTDRGVARVIAGALIALTLAFNAEELRRFRLARDLPAPRLELLPQPARDLASTIGLNQRWSMFAPRPARQDAWMRVVDARSGRDLLGGLPPGARPHTAGVLPLRWRQFVSQVTDSWDFEGAHHVLVWICLRDTEATTLSADVTLEYTRPPGEEELQEEVRFARVDCETVREIPQK